MRTQAGYLNGEITEDALIASMRSRMAHVSHANSVMMRRQDLEEVLGRLQKEWVVVV